MSVEGRASALRWRPFLRVWHRWFGLAVGVWLILLALTGSAIAFYDELDRILNPDLRLTSSREITAVDLDAAHRSAAAAVPAFSLRFVDIPNRSGETILFLGDSEEAAVQVFLDPANNTVLGWRPTEHVSFARRHIMDTLYALHVDLMLGEWGVWFIGLVALLWMIDHVFAAILAFPRFEKWRSAFVVGGSGFNLKRLFDLHRAPGLWAMPITFVLALSGVCLTWYEDTRAVVSLVTPLSERLHEAFSDHVVQTPVGLNAALTAAAARTNAPADSMLLIPAKGVYGVRSFDARDMDGYGRLWTYVHMADGKIVGQRHDIGESAGDTFFAWQYPLHSGKAFGLPGRIVVLVAGVVTTFLCLAGIWLWWRRRTPWR